MGALRDQKFRRRQCEERGGKAISKKNNGEY